MTENEARAWLNRRFGPAQVDRLKLFVQLLLQENSVQNLISSSTESEVWSRHIVDSAQLLGCIAPAKSLWLDVGSGGGLPGIVLACLRDGPIWLIEPRRRRAEFLSRVVEELCLKSVSVHQRSVEAVGDVAVGVISARAVSKVDRLFSLTRGITSLSTQFVLHCGKTGLEQIDTLRRSWDGTFHVKQSITNSEAVILVATGVRPR